MKKGILWSCLLCALCLPSFAGASAGELGLFSRPVKRGGFHFQAMFGGAGGPTSLGIWHNMEVGATLEGSGVTLAYTHVVLWQSPESRPADGSDMFGGHFFLVKVPLFFPEIVAKVAVGLGETVELRQGFVPFFGFGWHYGLDFHIPFFRRSGMTLSVNGVHTLTKHGHQVGFGLALGYTWF